MAEHGEGGDRRRARFLAVASLGTLAVAAMASAWRLLASQSPSSPLHVGPLLGPIEVLADNAWLGGVAGLALLAVLPRLGLPEAKERRAVRLLAAGWLVLLAAFVTGAALGTNGTQVIAAFPRTLVVLATRLAGFALLAAGLAVLLEGALSHRSK
ncbi:MAG: hypothetical protein PHU25_19375 [Deltaproteobacteria bacterium]|nr:hypothetical protein [Deltaproteobacteria bacterium]